MRSSRLAAGFFSLLLIAVLMGCEEETKTNESLSITGSSGDSVNLDGTWTSPCDGDDEASVTINGNSVAVAASAWLEDTDCEGDPDLTGNADFTIVYDQPVTITGWVDGEGVAGDPPTGLEDVTEANGMTLTINSFTQSPGSQEIADALNELEYCGFTDWAAGESKDITDCFLTDENGDPIPSEQKETWVVDDSDETLELYSSENEEDTDVVDSDGYPTEIINEVDFTK